MKALAFALTLLASASAFAYPAVGDHVAFTGTISQGSQSLPLTAEMHLMSYSKQTDTFMQHTKVVANGSVQEYTDRVAASDMLNKSVVDALLGSCAQQGGKLGQVTVPAGTFTACAFPFEDDESKGMAWVADVPFGIVRQVSVTKADGVKTDLLLQSFTHGN